MEGFIKGTTMTDMKCPFCNKPLQPTLRQSDEYWCENYDCPRTNIEWVGSQKLWQELIRTRKALDVARIGLEYIFGYEGVPEYVVKHIRQVLDQIKNETALEQKDVK